MREISCHTTLATAALQICKYAAGFLLLASQLLPTVTKAQGSISSLGTTYSENFNSLATSGTGNSLPSAWLFEESGSGANTTYAAGTGSSNTGNTYSFGDSPDRALGTLRSGNLTPTIGAYYTNNTGQTIRALSISYTGEQWRLGQGAGGRTDQLDFQYSVDPAATLTSGVYVDVNALDFISPNTINTGQLDGNLPANRTSIGGFLSGLSIAPGATFYLRWLDFDATGNDDGLGLDDFSITASAVPLPVELKSFTAEPAAKGTQLKWATASEKNNVGFDVQRGTTSEEFITIARVAGQGTTARSHSYEWLDTQPLTGLSYYRLRQLDTDGTESFSPVVAVKSARSAKVHFFPNPTTGQIILAASTGPVRYQVLNSLGQVLLTGNAANGGTIDVQALRPGSYFLEMQTAAGRQVQRFVRE